MADMLRGARLLLARLKPVKVPEAPARSFRDLWPGDAQRGARLLRGELEVAGSARPFTGWASAGARCNGAPPRTASPGCATCGARHRCRPRPRPRPRRGLAVRGASDPLAHAPEVAAARISAWLGHWEFFAATAQDGWSRQLMQRLAQDGRMLAAALPAEPRIAARWWC
jgi:hypothetical protein